MRTFRWTFALAVLLVCLFSFPSGALGGGSDDPERGSGTGNERILVKFKPEITVSVTVKVPQEYEGRVKETIPGIGAQVIEVEKGKGAASVAQYRLRPDVLYAEVDAVCTAAETPNDTYVGYQWAISKTQAPMAWEITRGSRGVKIAILDTGIDLDHPDLASKIVGGANFTTSVTLDDQHGHGTHVAGIAAAQTNNGLGVAGMGYESRLLNVKVLGDTGQGYMSWVAKGIIWAADNGANVISMSLGTTSPSSAVQDAINYAWNKGVVVVAAAGNNGSSTPFYPAYYSNCISVAATDSADRLASFSNRGDWVDVAAPGVSIYSTTRNGNYGYMSGTSMAAPHAAGLAALIFSAATDTNGNGRVNDEVRSLLEGGCDNLGLSGIGSGRINALKSLQGLSRAPATGSLAGRVTDATALTPIAGATVSCAGKSAVTDASGAYAIPDIPRGSYTASASAAGYLDQSLTVTIAGGQTSSADFALAPIPPATGSLAGRVTDATALTPIAGATVSCAGKSAVTDASGAYAIPDIPRGSYTASASAAGYLDQSLTVTIAGGQTSSADFALTPASTPNSKTMWVESLTLYVSSGNLWIRATAVGSEGPLSGVNVQIQLTRDGVATRSYIGTTDASGTARFALRNPPKGLYTVAVTNLTYKDYLWDSSSGVIASSYSVNK